MASDRARPGRRLWLAALLLACVLLPARAADLAILQQQGDRLHFSDDVGRELTLAVPLKRVVVFNRYTTEFVRAVGAMDTVIGVDIDAGRSGGYWPTVTPAMLAGQGQSSPNFEAIVAMKPQVVFMPRNSDWQKAAQVLAPFRITVVVLTAWDVLRHERNVTLLGALFGQQAKAARLNAFYGGVRELLAHRLAGVSRKRVYIEEVGNYKTLLKGSGWHDMVELGGGENVFGQVQIGTQPSARGSVQGFSVDPEEVIARRPEVIIKLEPAQYLPHPKAFSQQVLQGLAARPGFADLPAVRSGQVYHISYYLAGACSKIIGALQIAKWLYPDRFADVDPEQAMKQWLEQFQNVPAPGGYSVSLAELRR